MQININSPNCLKEDHFRTDEKAWFQDLRQATNLLKGYILPPAYYSDDIAQQMRVAGDAHAIWAGFARNHAEASCPESLRSWQSEHVGFYVSEFRRYQEMK